MGASNVWPQWVRRLKAYAITKSRREKVRRERLRAVIILMDYTIGVRSAQCEEWKQAYQSTLENDFNVSDIDSLCLSIIREKEDDWEEFCFAQKVIRTIFYYNESNPIEYMSRKIHEAFIRKLMTDAQTPYAGAIVRRTFKEIETKLIKSARQ
jgi:hypothetical protein